MESRKQINLLYGATASIIATGLLMFAVGDASYGFYQFLRIIVCSAALLVAGIGYQYKIVAIPIISLLIAVAFNPFIKIYLDESTWQILDVAAAVFFLSVSITFIIEYFSKNKKQQG